MREPVCLAPAFRAEHADVRPVRLPRLRAFALLPLLAATCLGTVQAVNKPAPHPDRPIHPLSEMIGRPPELAPSRTRPAGTATQPGEILVKLRDDSPAARALRPAKTQRGMSLQSVPAGDLRERLRLAGVTALDPVFRVAARNERPRVRLATTQADQTKREGLFRWYRLRLGEGVDSAAALEALRQQPEVEAVELNALYRVAAETPPPITGLPDGTTDPAFDQQWHLTATRTPNAWNHLKQNGLDAGGSRDVIVAVIDTGVDAAHEDLVANMWTNSGETAGNGLDDDGNGFIDDIHGCSVVSAVGSHSGDSSDSNGHGTHVAGIIAATAFNHAGGVGVAFNVQIMAVRAAQYSGTLTTADAAEGILYAIDHGAEVINMSFGGYARSQIMEDALEVALAQALLVAAAGNDGLRSWEYPFYPAALHYVHGVMASTPAMALSWFTNYGYDMAAPGVSIHSTLPGNQYAPWSGTSMAAPVVSGIGALLRSAYWQRDIYSVRFLMGTIWASPRPLPNGSRGIVVDAFNALTEQPPPGITLHEDWLFDNPTLHPANDGDGRVDAGETLELGLELINRAGYASQVIVRLEAWAEGAVEPDPYVSINVPLVDWGPMGPFIIKDNGFVYSEEGVVTGVVQPFVFTVSPHCPNDHVIAFKLTIDFEDGWDEEHPWYSQVSRFNYVVQRGKAVPTVIASGTSYTLTSDQYWIVGGPVLVEAGGTLQVEPGAQVQWGAISDEPYTPGPQSGHLVVRGVLAAAGTVEAPIAMFPSDLVAAQTVKITVEADGLANLRYAKVRNPELAGFTDLDHCFFEWDRYASRITARRIANSQFHKFRGGGEIAAASGFDRCLFDAGWIPPGPLNTRLRDCAFLQDNENLRPLQVEVPWAFSRTLTREAATPELFYSPASANGHTYVVMPLERGGLRLAETIAGFYGGHVTSIRDQAEYDFVKTWINGVPMIAGTMNFFVVGLSDLDHPGQFAWTDGTSLTLTDWQAGQPTVPSWNGDRLVVAGQEYRGEGKQWGWWVQTEWYSRWNGMPDWWKQFLLRLPGDWTIEQLSAPILDGRMLAHVHQHLPGTWSYNAFLSRYWDPNLNTWMRLRSPAEPNGYCLLRDNYFGTDSQTLIDHAIIDYYDNFTTARIEYGTPPAAGYATTYPFVQRIDVNGLNAVTVPEIGAGPATFRLTFNRNMDPAFEPFVTFGPSPPHTDFQIKARDEDFLEIPSGWVDARTWEGKAWITPVTGNGYHLLRASGAVAADDPWLVSGYDVGRFRFKVVASGVAAMTLQANGREGRIDLSWQQDDYDLLAGYNLYRAATSTGPFTRLNATLIPPGQEQYFDTDIEPAMPWYYHFTVVTTDFQESDPSNVATAAATDTIPPLLAHTPVVAAVAGRSLRLAAEATDNVRVASVTLRYRSQGGAGAYTLLAMINTSGNVWSATLPSSAVQPPGVEYYLTASDGLNEVRSGAAAIPHAIVVENQPTIASVTPDHGPAEGGTAVTIAGTQFQTGATVHFGSTPAVDVAVISANQIVCEAPDHFPAQVDVRVVNPDASQATRLNGYRFEASGMTLALPTATGDQGAVVEVALSANNTTGLRAAELVVVFDAAVLTAMEARVGTLVADWALASNLGTAGELRLSLAGTRAVSGSGDLAFLRFTVAGSPPAATPLTIHSASLNDGALTAQVSHGQFAVNGFSTVAGTVRYYQEARPVRGVTLDLVGAGVHQATTDGDGGFSLANLRTAAYTLLPDKVDDIAGITAYDASLVLQSTVGTLSLNAPQTAAADVNRNGIVSAMDAASILDQSVGLLTLPFPGAGRIWDFDPAQRSYALLSRDQPGQDFTAILIGDVSGNWTPPPLLQLNDFGPVEPGGAAAILSVRRANPASSDPPRWWVLFRSADLAVCSVDLTLGFDGPSGALQVQPGPLGRELMLAQNAQLPGRLRIAAAGAQPVRGLGGLLLVTASDTRVRELRIQSTSLNEGGVPVRVDLSGSAFDGDTDGDRQTDWHEILCGTDAADRASRLSITETVRQGAAGLVVHWASVPGRRYRLQAAPALGAASWQDVGAPVTAPTDRCSQVDPRAGVGRQQFYRVALIE